MSTRCLRNLRPSAARRRRRSRERRGVSLHPLSRSSPRKRGPIRRGLAFWHSGRRLPLQQTTVVMGPRVREDDTQYVGALGLSASLWTKFQTALFADIRSRSRRALRARFARNVLPSEVQKAQGMPGAQCARSLVCRKTNTRVSHHGHTGNHPAFPAQWFYGLLRALPGDHALLTPSPALLLADLTPALGRQNHTTSPYAALRSSSAPTASTASRPASVTIASRPSVGRDVRISELICPRRQAKF